MAEPTPRPCTCPTQEAAGDRASGGDKTAQCGASSRIGFHYLVPYIGPCILRRDHDGPVHEDANGTQWTDPRPARAGDRAALCPRPSDLRERLDEALRAVGLARNLAAYRDAVLPVVEADTAALRERAEKAERQRDDALAALTRHAAEAHRRKWAHEDGNQAAFDALHRLGDEILASRDRLLAEHTKETAAPESTSVSSAFVDDCETEAERPTPMLGRRVPLHRQAGYDAVYEVIRTVPGDAWRNALIWRAVEAYRAAAEPDHEQQVTERIVARLEALRDGIVNPHKPYNQAFAHGVDCAIRAAQGEAEPGGTWTVTVRVPISLPDEQRHALFTAVADAAHDWEPDDRDGWDVEVTAGPTGPPAEETDTTVEHTPGANAEDCPACSGRRDLPYPFICPGTDPKEPR